MDAIEYLTGQHSEVEELFDQIKKADGARKLELADQIADMFALHSALEEQIFYPECRGSDEVKELIEESYEEHEEVKHLLSEIIEFDEDELEDGFDDLVEKARAMIMDHVTDEEDQLFPRVRDAFGEEKLGTLGERMEELAEKLSEADLPPSERMAEELEQPQP